MKKIITIEVDYDAKTTAINGEPVKCDGDFDEEEVALIALANELGFEPVETFGDISCRLDEMDWGVGNLHNG